MNIDQNIEHHQAEIKRLLKEKRKTEDDWFQYALDDARFVTFIKAENYKLRWFFNRGLNARDRGCPTDEILKE